MVTNWVAMSVFTVCSKGKTRLPFLWFDISTGRGRESGGSSSSSSWQQGRQVVKECVSNPFSCFGNDSRKSLKECNIFFSLVQKTHTRTHTLQQYQIFRAKSLYLFQFLPQDKRKRRRVSVMRIKYSGIASSLAVYPPENVFLWWDTLRDLPCHHFRRRCRLYYLLHSSPWMNWNYIDFDIIVDMTK